MGRLVRLLILASVVCLILLLAWAFYPLSRMDTPSQAAQVDQYPEPPPHLDPNRNLLPGGARFRFGSPRLRHSPEICNSVVSPDGKLLATANGPSVAIWELATGKQIRLFVCDNVGRLNHPGLAFSPDGKRLGYNHSGDRAFIWDLNSGKEVWRSEWNSDDGWGFCTFTPDGKEFALSDHGRTRLWDLETGKGSRPSEMAWVAAISPDATTYVRLDSNEKAVIFGDTRSGKEKSRWTDIVTCDGGWCDIAFEPTGKMLALVEGATTLVEGEKTPRVKVREIGTGKIKASFPLPGSAKVRFNGHDFWDYKVGFSHDGETLFLGTGGGFVHRWELASGNELPALHAHAGTVTGLHSLPDGKTLITTGADGLIRFWDEKAGKPLLEMDGYQGQVHSAYSPDGRVIAVGDGLGRLHLWDAATGKRLRILREDGPAVLALAFAANGKTLAARLPKGEIRFWQMPSGQEGEAVHEQIPPGTESPQPLHLRPDGRHFDVSRIDHRVWSWEAGGTTFSHRGVDCASALSPDGRTLITAGRGPYLKVFNTDTGRPRLQFKLNSPAKDFEWDVVRALAFAPDGRRLAVALDDGEISICDPRTGAEVKRCVDEKGPGIGFQKFRDRPVWPDPITLAFSADGKWLASGSRFGPVRVWEVATGKVIRCLQGHEGEVLHVAFGPDGRTLLSSDNDGQAYLWDVRPSDLGGGGRPPDDLWRDLVGGDAVAAFAAVWEISEREDVGRDLRQRILPVKPVTKNRAAKPISALIADLNSEKFRVRDEATEDLAALGERAVAALTEALKKRPGLEVERRIQKLLDALRRGPTPEELRQMRAVQALELADTPEARAVLREWAGGAPGARLTEDARAALARLRERNVSGRRVP